MEVENNIENSFEINSQLEVEQEKFLETTLGKAINTGVDIGIRALLPDVIEDQVIDIKDNLLNYGLKEGINKTIESAINLGKSAVGIVTGKFDNISQIEVAVKNGGIIDSLSTVLDDVVDKVQEKGVIDKSVSSIIKKGKNTILNNVENNIEKTLTKQITTVSNLESNINKWKEYFNNKDFSNMEKQYTKIKKELTELIPLEKTLSEARSLENLHTLIKNNGQNFDLNETEKELLEKLS
jgi:hypothetical protein